MTDNNQKAAAELFPDIKKSLPDLNPGGKTSKLATALKKFGGQGGGGLSSRLGVRSNTTAPDPKQVARDIFEKVESGQMQVASALKAIGKAGLGPELQKKSEVYILGLNPR